MSNLEISFEVFPPKPENYEENFKNLIEQIEILKKFNPNAISVTYGAGGSNREKSLQIVREIKQKFDINVMPHFTCVCSSKDYIENYLREIEALNITDILALRGDEPQDIDVCYLDFKFAYELVEFIKSKTNLNISVAGYPEKHPRAKTFDDDIKNLKKKIDCGAQKIYTQLFFDNENFFKFQDKSKKANINAPIMAGILPIISYKQLSRMVSISNVILPNKLVEKLEKYKDCKEDTIKFGIEYAIKQCNELKKRDVCGFHFYILNKAHSTFEILSEIL